MRQKSGHNMNKYIRALPWVCLAAAFCILSVFMWNHVDMLIDSDLSSEMILAGILTEENSIITTNWYYSTELKVLNAQIIYSFFFRFLHDWTVVRMVSCTVSHLLMLSGFYYLLCQAGLKRYFAVSAIFLLLPFSDNYFEYVLLALIYESFIIISFFAAGLLLHYAKASGVGKKVLLAAVVLLAFAAGLGGARHVAVLYAPMLGAAVFSSLAERKPSKYLAGAVTGFASSAIGYLINTKILAESYRFATWGEIKLRFLLQGIMDIFFGTLRFFGYSYKDVKTPVASAFSCLVVAVLALSVLGNVVRKLKNPDAGWLLSMYVICAYGIFAVLYTFTDMLYSDRYAMSVIMFAVPIAVASLYEIEWGRPLKTGLCVILAAGFLISSAFRYTYYGRVDKTAEFRQIAAFLAGEKIQAGYATFWNGNVLTELSDGYIDVYCLKDKPGQSGIDDLLPWLQEAEHLQGSPDGPVFLLLSEEEYEAWDACPEREAAVYDTGGYVMFVFDGYEELKDSLGA